jgi:PAS domain S-box-containing protein
MAELLGYPREHLRGLELWEIGVFQDAEISKKAMATLQRLGRIRYENLPLQHVDGRHMPVEFVSNVYREGRRNVIQCNIRDITEREHLVQDGASQARRRNRQPVEKRVPGEYESQDPHADGRNLGVRGDVAAQEP